MQRGLVTSVGAAVLLAGVGWLYAPALDFAFLSFDDPVYVTANPHVAGGLTSDGIRWAFTTAHAGNWHPLSWLSHMLDVELFGLEPAPHHAVNVALHALNAALVFLVLQALTKSPGRSFVVAAVFALHPIQLESVAWIAERKNLLSTTFGLLALGAYAGYARRGGVLRFAGVALALTASLLAKAMLVTLPCVLLLFDVWPLGRHETTPLRRLLLEKLPLLLLSAGVSIAAWAAQASAGAMPSTAQLAWGARLAYVPIAYVGHLRHLVWPAELAVLYPHPLLEAGAGVSGSELVLALVVLGAITALAAKAAWRGRPAALIGWLFFLGTLVPVIGIVQVGNQALADRYAYVPLIGLLVAGVWSAGDAIDAVFVGRRRALAGALATAALCVLLALATRAQLPPWQSSRTLFVHAIAVTGPNPVMQRELGLLSSEAGDYARALPYFEQAVALAPDWSLARQNLGRALAQLGRAEQALPHLERAVALEPERATSRAALGAALLQLDRSDEAREQLAEAVRSEPSAGFLALLADAEARSGRPAEAAATLRRAIAVAETSGGADPKRLRAKLEALEQQREGRTP